MTLYSADISKLAKPVKKLQEAHKKLAARKKREPEPETEQVEVELKPKKRKAPPKKVTKKTKKAPVEESEEEEEEEEEPVPKKKKVAKKALPTPEPTEEEEPKPKKRVKKTSEEPKKRVKVLESSPLDCTPEPPKKRVRKPKQIEPVKENLEPPQWFNKYVEGVKKEEAIQKTEKVPAKQVKQEAQEVAQKSWNDGLTRDRVSNEVDSHMNRMYSMIFKR
jgi:hypothetical protein